MTPEDLTPEEQRAVTTSAGSAATPDPAPAPGHVPSPDIPDDDARHVSDADTAPATTDETPTTTDTTTDRQPATKDRASGRTAPAVGLALAKAGRWARSVVQRRSRTPLPGDTLKGMVAELPEAGPDLMVALDIDGTILHHDTRLSDRVAESVTALRDTGTHLMLATGRSVFATVPVARQIGLMDRYAVSSNGAVTVMLDQSADDGYTLDHVVTFDPEPALRALRTAIPDGVFAVEDVGVGFRLSSPFPPGELAGEWTLVDFEDLCSKEVTRLTLRAAHLDAETFDQAVRSAGMHSVTFAIGWSSWVDVAPEGISKATALERIRQIHGVAPEATVTCGDGSNDVEMLAWAGLGVAMGDARPEVRGHARAEVPSVEEDGLVDLLDLLLADR